MTLFHLHVDGHCMNDSQIKAVERFGFVKTPFRLDLGGAGFEAPYHFTVKMKDSRYFKALYGDVVDVLKTTTFEGYVEGECVSVDTAIPYRAPAGAHVRLTGRTRFEGLDDGGFRKTELHIAYNHDKSDRSFRDSLMKLGFFSAFMDKPYGLCEILTIQGTSKAIEELETVVTQYLREVPGVCDCSIKREDIAKYWLSRPDVKRAPVLVEVADLRIEHTLEQPVG